MPSFNFVFWLCSCISGLDPPFPSSLQLEDRSPPSHPKAFVVHWNGEAIRFLWMGPRDRT
ncbi:unnamed protein product, partial [Choristocarpus tenellus]